MNTTGRMRRTLQWIRSRWVSIVGWSELAGGVGAAIVLGFQAMGVGTDSPGLARQMLVPMLLFCAASVVAGRLLLLRRPLGRLLSMPIQAAQVMHVTVGGVGIRVAAGLAVTVLYKAPGAVDGTLGVDALFRVGPTGVPWEFGVNAVALGALTALLRHPMLDRIERAASPAEERTMA